ncbi:MAG TPA: hypothetical protein VLZ83_02130 [Edaphocola sp.]|nr:hypothetical protein [Edaphocola sp.]
MNVLQSNNAGDVSLESIAVMAQATPENGGGTKREWILTLAFEEVWEYTYSLYPPFLSASKVNGHKATCSNQGDKVTSCVDYVHKARKGDTCADCDTYKNLK